MLNPVRASSIDVARPKPLEAPKMSAHFLDSVMMPLLCVGAIIIVMRKTAIGKRSGTYHLTRYALSSTVLRDA